MRVFGMTIFSIRDTLYIFLLVSFMIKNPDICINLLIYLYFFFLVHFHLNICQLSYFLRYFQHTRETGQFIIQILIFAMLFGIPKILIKAALYWMQPKTDCVLIIQMP